jgi:hypothetical protein
LLDSRGIELLAELDAVDRLDPGKRRGGTFRLV